jgi:dihydroorotate dehydrogenase electron transfer subunit
LSKLFRASVIENRKLIEEHYLLTLQPDGKIKKPVPGNFFMLSAGNGLDPLLKRPLSIHRCIDNTLQFLYRVVGRGTDFLSRKTSGDSLELIGPLGKGFPNTKSSNLILVAGGLGIAPIYYLAERFRKRKPLLFYGAKTGENILMIDELKSLGIDPLVSTDDGTYGKKGYVVDVLKKYMTRHSLPLTRYTIYACGPEQMFRSLSSLSLKYNMKGFVALEQNMACGVGTCLGCVVNTTRGYKRVCQEGPVFPMEEIIWD